MFKRRSTSLLHRTVVVNLLSGNAVSGVCDCETTTALVLKGATIHADDADPAPADGALLIDRANIDFVQII